MKFPVATYTIISTSGQTVEPQRIELLNFCALRQWGTPLEFTDVISGAKSSRTGLDALMAAVRRKEIGAVLVVKLDRVARSLSHFASIIAELNKHGVAFIATSQGIDTSNDNPAGQLTMNILASIAQFERSLIIERTKAGLAAAKARGARLGKPSPNLLPNYPAIVQAWRAEGGRHLRDLSVRLGGVSVSTAFRLAKEGVAV